MSDDVERALDDAASSLREATDRPASDDQVARTRARILATHRGSRARVVPAATTWLAAAAALVIVLGGSTAWAYWSGQLARWVGTPDEAAPVTTSVTPPPMHPPASVVRTPEPEPEPLPEPEPETSLPPATTIAPSTVETDQAPRGPEADESAEELPVSDSSAVPLAPIDPRERAAYRSAHALHFEQHDAAGAIDAWDAYLREYPHGRFALEARYNRALCLVRVGRRDDARAALAPFAAGTHGGYRQSEATQLLEALDAQP